MTTLHTKAALFRGRSLPSSGMAPAAARDCPSAGSPFAGIEVAVAAAAILLWVVLALN